MVVFFKSSFQHFSYFPGFNSRMLLVWLQGIFNQTDIFWTKKGSRLHMWPLMISVSFVSSGVMWLNNDRDTGSAFSSRNIWTLRTRSLQSEEDVPSVYWSKPWYKQMTEFEMYTWQKQKMKVSIWYDHPCNSTQPAHSAFFSSFLYIL